MALYHLYTVPGTLIPRAVHNLIPTLIMYDVPYTAVVNDMYAQSKYTSNAIININRHDFAHGLNADGGRGSGGGGGGGVVRTAKLLIVDFFSNSTPVFTLLL